MATTYFQKNAGDRISPPTMEFLGWEENPYLNIEATPAWLPGATCSIQREPIDPNIESLDRSRLFEFELRGADISCAHGP